MKSMMYRFPWEQSLDGYLYTLSEDEAFQALSTVQGSQGPPNRTIASDTTVAPTTFITYISGTAQIATVTPPAEGDHMLIFIFTGSPGTFLTTGNVTQAIVPTQHLPTFLIYNSLTQTYTGGTTNLT